MSLKIALLGLLDAKGPASGYDLAKAFESSISNAWQAGHTQIYPELVKMAADGLVAVESEGARNRKIYAITPEGARLVRSWLIEHQPTAAMRSEVALQAFLLPLLDREDAIEVVLRLRRQFSERLAGLECRPVVKASGFGRYALRLGIAQGRAALDWADDTLAELREAGRDGEGSPAETGPRPPEAGLGASEAGPGTSAAEGE
ncbi:PadR family transcriptional regulator [Nonomuraea rhizosphaerae]|uniref:PadR family transcriptional regulator n=1 Tax=Nonomuraea rhizosphaerae TaxID=2665663 RepID=UPI001C6009C9|nr:PadR family transcriptional regulator [Nonomuraea rhizosphaerae]